MNVKLIWCLFKCWWLIDKFVCSELSRFLILLVLNILVIFKDVSLGLLSLNFVVV